MTQINESPARFIDGGPWDGQTRVIPNDLCYVVTPVGDDIFAKYFLAKELDSVGFRVFEFAGSASSMESAMEIRKPAKKSKRKKPA